MTNKLKQAHNYKSTYAIVTGASRGLGFEYVKVLLDNNINVICVARNTTSLHKIQQDAKLLNLDVVLFDLDLSQIINCEKLVNLTGDYNVSLLINNAGFGVWGLFDKTDVNLELNMIDLNIKALHYLTKAFLKRFKSNNFGRVLNISSMVSFTPGPVYSAYYASKAYVNNLSVAINFELKQAKSKVRVITLAPGSLRTDFWPTSSNQDTQNFKDSKFNNKVMMSPAKFAKNSLKRGLTTNKDYVIIGTKNKLLRFFTKHIAQKHILKTVYKFQISRKK